MSLREQFEAWCRKEYPYTYDEWDDDSMEYKEAMWQAFQAGHAASGREELLEACEALLVEFHEWEEHHGTHPDADRARAAIKKARGEQ